MRRVWLIAALLSALSTSANSAELLIIRDGASDYAIVTPKAFTPREDFAAHELARYLKQITGVELPINRGAPLPAKAIVVAEWSNARGEGIASRPGQGLLREQNTIAAAVSGPHIEIMGGNERGVVYGTYRFLDLLGCRFLAPDLKHYEGSSEVIPRHNAVSFDPKILEGSFPKLSFRKLYVEEGHSHDLESLKAIVNWMPKAGYNTLVVPTDYQGSGRVKWDNWRAELTPELQKRGIIIEVGGHGYQNFLRADMEAGKLFERHPDWFGQDETGKRRSEAQWVFCTSNAAAVDYVLGSFLDYINKRPEIQIFDFWPPDGAKWCQCEPCRKLGEPPDRQAILLRHVKEKLDPRRSLQLEVIAYSSYLNPPAREKIDRNVLVDFCPIAQRFDAQINEPSNATYSTALLAWRKSFTGYISIYSYYRKYAWDSLPVIIPHYMQKDLHWYFTVPVDGVSSYAEPGDWFTYELNHYVLGQLAFDPDANVDTIVKKFCDARYGGESSVAQAAMATLENSVRNYCSVPHVPLKPADEIKSALDAMQKTVDAVTEAQEREKNESIKRNLGRLKLMCTYALRDLEIQYLRATSADAKQIEAKATELHQFLESNADQGVFLMRGGRLSVKRMLSRYGVATKE